MMDRIHRMSRGGWITVGLLLGAILAPAVALAAFTDVRIVGVGGQPAVQVTPSNQLRTAEMDPARFRRFATNVTGDEGCVALAIPPASSFMLKHVAIDVWENLSPSGSDAILVFANGLCTGAGVGSVTPSGSGPFEIPLGLGVPIPKDGLIGVDVLGTGIIADVFLSG